MRITKLGFVLLFCTLASCCSHHDDFTGKWSEIHNSAAEQAFLEITANGANDILKTTHSQAIVGNQVVSASHLDVATHGNETLQMANGLITITIDKTTGHLIFPRADRTWEFKRTS